MELTNEEKIKIKKLLEIEKLRKDIEIKQSELSDGFSIRADDCKTFRAGLETEIQNIEKSIKTLQGDL